MLLGLKLKRPPTSRSSAAKMSDALGSEPWRDAATPGTGAAVTVAARERVESMTSAPKTAAQTQHTILRSYRCKPCARPDRTYKYLDLLKFWSWAVLSPLWLVLKRQELPGRDRQFVPDS